MNDQILEVFSISGFEKLFTIYSESQHELEYAKDVAKQSKVFVVMWFYKLFLFL